MREGIKAIPYMIKPNDEELSRLLGKPLSALEELIQAGQSLLKTGIQEVVISLGSKGGLFLSKEDCFLAEALTVPVRSTVGAGDSMVAAMAYGKEKHLPRQQQIQLAVAMGAASVMCDGRVCREATTGPEYPCCLSQGRAPVWSAWEWVRNTHWMPAMSSWLSLG